MTDMFITSLMLYESLFVYVYVLSFYVAVDSE